MSDHEFCRDRLSPPRPGVVAHATAALSEKADQRACEGGEISPRFADELAHAANTQDSVTLCSAPSMPRRVAPTLRATGIDRACAQRKHALA